MGLGVGDKVLVSDPVCHNPGSYSLALHLHALKITASKLMILFFAVTNQLVQGN